jgi:KUP system potassium uptake protein
MDEPNPRRSTTLPLALGALGVVYGDIGTSPLYAIKECFHGLHAIRVSEGNVLGVLSLVFWSLTVVVAVKYLGFIMRADNRGEGGIFALLALVPGEGMGRTPRRSRGLTLSVVVLAALFGASLLYGDGIITPAISVLSAVEGLAVAAPGAEPLVLPITLIVLLGLFLAQRRGTGGIGRVFGPVMLLWFTAIALLGLYAVARNPRVLAAVNPAHAVAFFAENRLHGMVVLGSVVLCITGGEALYADMGHFGRRPIRLSWFVLVFPALLLNYFGQGALLLARPDLAENPFYGLVPRILLYPMVALATVSTVIASQALISGAFSLTQQAVQLGYLPRVQIVHTSGEQKGQIYIPEVNAALMVGCIGLVLAFGQSSKLASAYGLAVTMDMTITSIVFFFVITRTWRWSYGKAVPLVALFLCFDVSYFGANLFKFLDGGWFPMLVALGMFTVMTTWKRGREELARRMEDALLPLDLFLQDVERRKPHRVHGTAVFMSSSLRGTPPVLLHHLKHNQVLHHQVVLLSLVGTDVPMVRPEEGLQVQELGNGFYRLVARLGFMQTPNVPEVMRRAWSLGLSTDPSTTSYYLGRETLLTGGRARMANWRKQLFAFISKNARTATAYFGLPPGRVIELGMQIDL